MVQPIPFCRIPNFISNGFYILLNLVPNKGAEYAGPGRALVLEFGLRGPGCGQQFKIPWRLQRLHYDTLSGKVAQAAQKKKKKLEGPARFDVGAYVIANVRARSIGGNLYHKNLQS